MTGTNTEYFKQWWAKNREEQLAVRRWRYANDHEFRAKVIAARRAFRARKTQEKAGAP